MLVSKSGDRHRCQPGIGAAIADRLAGEAVSWLISPDASFVTGTDVTVSGGL
jgi:hypothetical protein